MKGQRRREEKRREENRNEKKKTQTGELVLQRASIDCGGDGRGERERERVMAAGEGPPILASSTTRFFVRLFFAFVLFITHQSSPN